MIKVVIENFKGHHLSLDYVQKKVYIESKIRFAFKRVYKRYEYGMNKKG